jgi:hypothetical protein
VAAALNGVRRAYFGLSVSADRLLAATILATVAKGRRGTRSIASLTWRTSGILVL